MFLFTDVLLTFATIHLGMYTHSPQSIFIQALEEAPLVLLLKCQLLFRSEAVPEKDSGGMQREGIR